MAVLVPQDWHPPRDQTMDPAPSSPINSTVPRQRSSPANDQHPQLSSPSQQQPPYPYPVQQQQAAWPSSQQQQQQQPPYYPAFYQNHPQQPYPVHGHSPLPQQQQQLHPQNPYYDPANAQFAQWAYQQMMYNAQQAHHMSHVPTPMGSSRGRNSAANSSDYFALNQMPAFNPFPSGTPPPHPSQLPNGYPSPADHHQQSQYNGFHPYRRPQQRSGSSTQEPAQPSVGEWRAGTQMGSFQPPYARADAAGSSTSLNSGGSTHSNSARPRTNSTHGSANGGRSSSPAPAPHQSHPKAASTNGHGRGSSVTSTTSTQNGTSSSRPHNRTTSSSSSSSSGPRPSAVSANSGSGSTSSAHAPATLRKPSPLSQGTYTAAEKRMSRDDSDLAAMMEPSPNTPGVRSGGLKGRLRRALSLNANATLREEEEDSDAPVQSTSSHPVPSNAGTSQVMADDESTATVQKKKSRSLFNSRLNRSTDNISLSSTMSSASMVIRKLGSMAKLTRRNSLAGITSLFKDKKDGEEEGDGGGKKSKKKKSGKGVVAEASVSHVTAELDRADWNAGADLAGLSPAARLARQHTLKSNAEAAARAKAEQEARAAAAAAAANQQPDGVPTTWEKNTTTRQGENVSSRVNEDGMRVVVEEDDSDSDGDGEGAHQAPNYSIDGWDDDEDWGEVQEEDVTIRADLEGVTLEDGEEMEPWATNVRRSIEKTRRPKKGILKMRPDGSAYEQDDFLPPNPAFNRLRSNSYDSSPSQSEVGPLARMPSPDPDHIDGLHKHGLHSSSPNGSTTPVQSDYIPPLSFDSNGLTLNTGKDLSDTGSTHSPIADKSLFNHPNSSAPALSTVFSPNPPTLSQRSATAPSKRLAFASNLSVYDTFPATVYDRRSEPATWSRLTPALAQRIKEELNSYKMEEMEVHASSRVHTQFFV